MITVCKRKKVINIYAQLVNYFWRCGFFLVALGVKAMDLLTP